MRARSDMALKEHIASQHLVVADTITTLAAGGAAWGYFTNYLTPSVSFLVLLSALVWYWIQISGSPRWVEWRKHVKRRQLARLRRRHRSRPRKHS
jgi:hypothetical protein